MLTAIKQQLNKELSRNLGSGAYITKPFTPHHLLETIRLAIESPV